jgi:hypothetical protein
MLYIVTGYYGVHATFELFDGLGKARRFDYLVPIRKLFGARLVVIANI